MNGKQDYTVRSYKADKRTKAGEKLIATAVFKDKTEAEMKAVVEAFELMNPEVRIEYYAAMMTVKNLMTGKDVQIPSDTPWCCNPASETYWSM
jgi:hypothetical protein